MIDKDSNIFNGNLLKIPILAKAIVINFDNLPTNCVCGYEHGWPYEWNVHISSTKLKVILAITSETVYRYVCNVMEFSVKLEAYTTNQIDVAHARCNSPEIACIAWVSGPEAIQKSFFFIFARQTFLLLCMWYTDYIYTWRRINQEKSTPNQMIDRHRVHHIEWIEYT